MLLSHATGLIGDYITKSVNTQPAQQQMYSYLSIYTSQPMHSDQHSFLIPLSRGGQDGLGDWLLTKTVYLQMVIHVNVNKVGHNFVYVTSSQQASLAKLWNCTRISAHVLVLHTTGCRMPPFADVTFVNVCSTIPLPLGQLATSPCTMLNEPSFNTLVLTAGV